MADIKTVAQKAAKEDALPTGGAKLPGAEPVRTRPTLSDAERKARAEEQLESRIEGMEYRVQQVCNALVDMGVSSLAGQLSRYTDVPYGVKEEAVRQVQERMDKVMAALKASTAQTAVNKSATISLRAALGRQGQP